MKVMISDDDDRLSNLAERIIYLCQNDYNPATKSEIEELIEEYVTEILTEVSPIS